MQYEIELAYDDIETVKQLFSEYTASLGIDLSYQNYQQELAELPGKYDLPKGRLYLVYVDNKPAGCIGLRAFDAQRGEIKRLYIKDEYRGSHLGEQLVNTVINAAREIGYQALLLDTLHSMKAARQLYEKLSFREIPAYYPSPIETTVYYELILK